MPSTDTIITIEQEKADEFANRLLQEAERAFVEGELTTRSAGFAEVAAGYIVQDGAVPDYLPAPFDERVANQSVVISGYCPVDDYGTLRLFTTDYSEAPKTTIGKSDFEGLVRRAAQFYTTALKRPEAITAPSAKECADHIRDNATSIRLLKIIVTSNRRVTAEEVEARRENVQIQSETFDIDRLYRISDTRISRKDIRIDFNKMPCGPIPCLEVSGKDYPYKTYLLMLDGETLYALAEKYGSRLYELNLRSYLQSKTSVNKGILATIKHQPERFLAYNNGLCATADEVTAGFTRGQTIITELVGFQIVNGAQTTSSIHKAKAAGKDLLNVHVAVKLTKVDGGELEEFVPLITEYANTQNPIKSSDLRSNLEFHRRIEELSESIWTTDGRSRWFYERARGAYEAALARYGSTTSKKAAFKAECPKSRVFKKEDVSTQWTCWDGHPEIAAKGAQKTFSKYMEVAKDKTPDGDFYRQTIALLILGKAIEKAIKRSGITGYKAQIRCYVLAMLKHRYGERFDLANIWHEQSLSKELHSVLEQWAKITRDVLIQTGHERGLNITEWCKKPELWEILKATNFPTVTDIPETESLYSKLEAELEKERINLANGANNVHSSDDQALCVSLTERQWSKIATWGANGRLLDDFDRKVTATMLNLSIGGWRKAPTPKQAAIAARVVRTAMAAGIVGDHPTASEVGQA